MELNLTSAIHRRNARRLARSGRHVIRDLAHIRNSRDISRSRLADIIGIHKSGISRFERGGADPRLSTLLRYAHAVGASLTIKVEPVEDWESNDSFSDGVVSTTRLSRLWAETDGDDDLSLVSSHSSAFSARMTSVVSAGR